MGTAAARLMDTTIDLVRSLATALVVAVGIYSYTLILIGRTEKRPPPMVNERLYFVVLVPCLNEAAVIGRTLASLISMRGRYHIAVLDDASDDASAAVVRRFPRRMVTLIERSGSDSRVGKGAALNHGYRDVVDWNVERLFAPENVIIVVFDSDSQVPTDFFERVGPYFQDPGVVGVQTAVRMYNAGVNRLTFWQHLEFVVWARVFSRAKDRIGSATLGGNGQCVRLSSLKSLGASPWRPSLAEDLDLSLRLILAGGRIRFCGETYVEQEAVSRFGQLVRQRSRWVQGHLVAWEHLRSIVRSQAPRRVRIDLAIFLLLPAALTPLAFAVVDGWRIFLAGLSGLSIESLGWWYLLAFSSVPVTLVALARDRLQIGSHPLLQAHLFVLYGLFWMIAAGRAAVSIIRGDRSWAKTSRAPFSSIGRSGGAKGDPHESRQHRLEWSVRSATLVAGFMAVLAISTMLLAGAATMAFDTYSEIAMRQSPVAAGADSFRAPVIPKP